MPPVEFANNLDLETYVAYFLPDCRDGLIIPAARKEDHALQVVVKSAYSIEPQELRTCLDLIEATSKKDYLNSSIGWQPRKKLEEMKLLDLRYLLVRQKTSLIPEAFASFMITYEDKVEVVYLYEIHLSTQLRGKGLGKMLMSLVEGAGRKAGMKKLMLTVFASNKAAKSFYKGLGYGVDEYSPEPRRLRSGVIKEPDYAILSKEL